MGNINSSGAVERFTLASGESKVFRNKQSPYGPELGNVVEGTVHGDEDVDQNGNPVATGSAVVKLQTSEDNVTFTDVVTATVVSRGHAPLNGTVGAYWKVLNNGPALAHVDLKAINTTAVIVPGL